MAMSTQPHDVCCPASKLWAWSNGCRMLWCCQVGRECTWMVNNLLTWSGCNWLAPHVFFWTIFTWGKYLPPGAWRAWKAYRMVGLHAQVYRWAGCMFAIHSATMNGYLVQASASTTWDRYPKHTALWVAQADNDLSCYASRDSPGSISMISMSCASNVIMWSWYISTAMTWPLNLQSFVLWTQFVCNSLNRCGCLVRAASDLTWNLRSQENDPKFNFDMLMGMEQQAELLPATYLFMLQRQAVLAIIWSRLVKMAKDPTQVRRVSW